jgi:NTE family protein
MAGEQALVLGGGGVARIAWITGLLAGLADAGQDISGADVIIGTSAGANVAAQIGSGLGLDELFARQTEPSLQAAEIAAELDLETWGGQMQESLAGASSPQEVLRRIGAWALASQTVPEPARRAVIESRLPSHEWPSRPIRLTALDCATGEMRVFDAQSGVSLVDAVGASSAVPGVWPPVTIGGSRYMDGGVRSMDNADLAEGAARITVVSPFGLSAPVELPVRLADVVARLREGGAQVTVIEPDQDSVAAMGPNPLDPGTRAPAAQAGRAQGHATRLET